MMKQFILRFIFFILTPSLFAATPWFTGPLLANSGTTVSRNHLLSQTAIYYLMNTGQFLNGRITNPTGEQINASALQFETLGITDALDGQIYSSFNHNEVGGVVFNGIGDTIVTLGYQLFRQSAPLIPNFRLSIQETVPTGRFNTDPLAEASEVVGVGSYLTNIGLNFSQQNEIRPGYDIQSTLNLNYLYASPIPISAIGGHLSPGNLISIDFALEASLTKNWAIVIETYCSHKTQSALTYSSSPAQAQPFLTSFNTPSINLVSLAPAIEYNFSENFGIIAGNWFSIGGKNRPIFSSPALTVGYTF